MTEHLPVCPLCGLECLTLSESLDHYSSAAEYYKNLSSSLKKKNSRLSKRLKALKLQEKNAVAYVSSERQYLIGILKKIDNLANAQGGVPLVIVQHIALLTDQALNPDKYLPF